MNEFNFAKFYELCAEQIGRIPDDEIGFVLAEYLGRHRTLVRTTRVDMITKKGWKLKESELGYFAEKSKSKEIDEKIKQLQGQIEELKRQKG